MKPSSLIRTLFAAGALSCAVTAMAQSNAANPAPPAPGAATSPAAPPATHSGAVPGQPEIPDPAAEEARKKVEAMERKKKEEARRKAEKDAQCVIRPVMSDAEIAKCR